MVKLNSLNIKKEKQIIDHEVHRKTLLIRQQPCAPLSHSMNRVDVEWRQREIKTSCSQDRQYLEVTEVCPKSR